MKKKEFLFIAFNNVKINFLFQFFLLSIVYTHTPSGLVIKCLMIKIDSTNNIPTTERPTNRTKRPNKTNIMLLVVGSSSWFRLWMEWRRNSFYFYEKILKLIRKWNEWTRMRWRIFGSRSKAAGAGAGAGAGFRIKDEIYKTYRKSIFK